MKISRMVRMVTSQPSLRKLSVDQRKMYAIVRGLLYATIGSSLIILLSTFFDLSTSSSPSKHTIFEQFKGMPVDLRRDVARDLRNAFNDLKRAKDYNQPPTTRTLLQLERILGRLDPRLVPLQDQDPMTDKKKLVADNQTEALEVCPEHYKGRDRDDTYYSSSFISDCPKKVPLKELVTVIIDATDYKESLLDTLLTGIVSRYSEIPVHVALSSRITQRIVERYSSVTLVRVTSSTPPAVRWSRLIRQVTTKYVVVGYNMAAFSTYTDLERLIRVYRQVPHASYVSGATRNETGHWTLECYQARLELYGMSLREGYTSSAEDCMYCDAVKAPFLTTAKLLTSLPLDEKLPEAVVFVDWFLRVRANDGLGIACPDVLFFVKGDLKKSLSSHASWRDLAAKWGVTDIYLPARSIHRFTCEEAGLKCTTVAPYLASPPCCVARLSRALREAIAAFDKAAVSVHIAQNTVVGGVKGGLQPWDALAYLTSSDTKEEIENALSELRRYGFRVEKRSLGKSIFYHLSAHSHIIKLLVEPIDMQGKLPIEDKETPTRIHIGNGWVPAPPNPGLYARGFQGRGSLQHRPLDGSWPRCEDPSHHGCLDHLPLDGSWARLR